MTTTTRPPALFAWRKPRAEVLIPPLFKAAILLSLTFIIVFGILPPFWQGKTRGVETETLQALEIVSSILWNKAFDIAQPFFPILPDFLRAGDFLPDLQQQPEVLAEFLLRICTTIAAVIWAGSLLVFLSYRKTERVQGFEYVSGPRLWEGHQATQRANAVIKAEDGKEKNGVFLAVDVLLSRAREVLSFAIFGSQGSGKSTALRFLLRQLIGRPNTKLIVLDQKGDFTSTWPTSDVILFAPHDRRSNAWDIGADIVGELAAREFAASLIEAKGDESIWPQGAREIIEAVIVALQTSHGTNWGFLELLDALQSSPVELRNLVESVRPNTKVFLGIEENGDFTRTSIGYVTNLQAAALPLLRPLAISWGKTPAEMRVSLKDWLHDKESPYQTLILQNSTDFPDISAAWMRQVIKRLVAISGSSSFPDSQEHRLWFLLDEFPQLGKMPELLKVPETHRSKGVTLLVTAQSISQIYANYGQHDADTLVSLLQTKIILNPGQGSDLVTKINNWLGKLRFRDPRESSVTENGMPKAIPEHETDLITPDYMSGLGKIQNHINGLVIGFGQDAYRLSWPLQNWPVQRPPVIPAEWAKPSVTPKNASTQAKGKNPAARPR